MNNETIIKLPKQVEEITSQLDNNTKVNFEKNVNNKGASIHTIKQQEPIVVFIDDDGYRQVYEVLKPLFLEKYKVPFVTAVVGSWIDNVEGRLTSKQINELYNLGVEIASHTHTHKSLNTNASTLQEIEDECRLSKQAIEKCGASCETLVYPWGQQVKETRKIVSKYFKCGVTTNGNQWTNLPPHNTYAIKRVGIGTMTDNQNGEFAPNSLEYYKQAVDKCLAEKSLLVFMMHVANTTPEQMDFIDQTIAYIKSKDIPIMTMTQAMNRVGNIIECGDYYDSSAKSFGIDCNGATFGTGASGVVQVTPRDSYGSTTDIESFDDKKITITECFSDKSTFPNSAVSIIETDRTGARGFEVQKARWYNSRREFIRLKKDDGTTTDWRRYVLATNVYRIVVGLGAIQANTIKDAKVSIPEAKAGSIINCNPWNGVLPTGLMFGGAFISAVGEVTIRVANITGATIGSDGSANMEWAISVENE